MPHQNQDESPPLSSLFVVLESPVWVAFRISQSNKGQNDDDDGPDADDGGNGDDDGNRGKQLIILIS